LFFTGCIQAWAFIQSERANLFFQIATIVPYPLAANQPMWVQVNVTNTGKAQAFVVDEKIAFHIDKRPLSGKAAYPESNKYHAKGFIPAGNTRHILIGPTTDRTLSESEIATIKNGESQFYIYGFAKFTDDFTILGPREVGFCVVYNPVDPTNTPGPRLDDCDNPAYVYSR
jgi:hypothetical protein